MTALNNKSNDTTTRQISSYLLSGLLKCGKCGSNMIVQTRKVKGETYRYYVCGNYHKNGREACSQQNLKADLIERKVIMDVKDEIALMLMIDENKPEDASEVELKEIYKEIAEIDIQLDGLRKSTFDLFIKRDTFNEDQFEYMNNEFKQNIDELLVKKNHLIEKSEGQNRKEMLEMMEKFIYSPIDEILEHKDSFKILIKEIIVIDEKVDIYYNLKR